MKDGLGYDFARPFGVCSESTGKVMSKSKVTWRIWGGLGDGRFLSARSKEEPHTVLQQPNSSREGWVFFIML